MKPNGILLLRVVENKLFSKNISLREITYHDQISNLPNVLVLPPNFLYGGIENPMTPTVIKGDASGRLTFKDYSENSYGKMANAKDRVDIPSGFENGKFYGLSSGSRPPILLIRLETGS
ncbi:hypothetical protein Dsin_013104 [Dipteronia sinensis]|uniref:Uncharacterized protein n=1 Tax=Dipteronia sinensis TaxID=43782 RepID=A0AAE0AKL6_9ROSI|nr:hypothetical protein Dsin_013104 [Dipteronia sinensis]